MEQWMSLTTWFLPSSLGWATPLRVMTRLSMRLRNSKDAMLRVWMQAVLWVLADSDTKWLSKGQTGAQGWMPSDSAQYGPSQGLRNGTRLVITRASTHDLEGRILGGEYDGKPGLIPHITLCSRKSNLTFILARRQFLVRLAFAMTIKDNLSSM